MPTPSFTPDLQASYQRLFDTCVITPDKYPQVDAIVKKILDSRTRYETVGKRTGVPWYFIAIVHMMESGGNFKSHLHNGDPLAARTVNVPKGRPATGAPPFTWEASAEDAIYHTGVNKWTDWSLPGLLYKLEGYNGYGYRKASIAINTPYLWSFSNHYTKGKYVADGSYSPAAVSKQAGAAVLLRRLAEKQVIAFTPVDRTAMIRQVGDMVVYAPSKYSAKAEELQKLLNLNGAYLKPDGKAGEKTSNAYYAATGFYLKGDPRIS